MSGEGHVDGGSAPSCWRSFHVHYHADLDRLLVEFVSPLCRRLSSERRIARFFFVRYGLGGPHVRLRVRVVPGGASSGLADEIAAAAAAYLARAPSTGSYSKDLIQRINESVLRTDANESDDSVYPDNFLREAPFHPEIERYGGSERLPLALDYFALSSVRALGFLARHGAQPRARQLPVIVRLLFREALGFAGDADELLALLSFPSESMGAAAGPMAARGDRMFEERRELFLRLLQVELDDGGGGGAPLVSDPGAAAELLSSALAGVANRRAILSSQLHMTANRLGLQNAEEVYLSRLLWRAARALGTDRVAACLAERRRACADAGERLSSLAASINTSDLAVLLP